MEWFTHAHVIFRHLTLTTQVPVFTWPVSILALQRAELANVIIVPFPSPCWKLRGFFPPIFTARPWENSLSQSHQSVETPLWRVPPEFNPCICPHWAPGDCQSLGFLSPLFPWRCLLGAGWGGGWGGVSAPVNGEFLNLRCSHFSRRHLPSDLTSLANLRVVDFPVSSAFYLLRQGGDF